MDNTLPSRVRSIVARAALAIADEVMRLSPAAPSLSPRRKRARGRPARAAAAPRTAKKRAWPACSKPRCSNRFFGPSGDRRLCYPHFVKAGGKHPGSR